MFSMVAVGVHSAGTVLHSEEWWGNVWGVLGMLVATKVLQAEGVRGASALCVGAANGVAGNPAVHGEWQARVQRVNRNAHAS